MKFTFVTLFESLISPYFSNSILSRAKEENLIECEFINPRDFTLNRHKKVDEYKIGGGAGLLMSSEPLDLALKEIKRKNKNAYIIFPTPAGKPFLQNDAKRLVKKEHIVFVCGRYEGIDERILELHANEVFSLGDFVLTGGELPALCMCDAICRMKKGVLGNEDSLYEESFENSLLEAPAFTKPNVYNNLKVPSEFLKGNHGNIASLKNRLAYAKTQFFRPDLYKTTKTKS